MEWERQRRDQLMSEKLQEQSTVDQLSIEVGQLRQELDVLVSRHCHWLYDYEMTLSNVSCSVIISELLADSLTDVCV